MVNVRNLLRNIGLMPRESVRGDETAEARAMCEQPQVESGSTLDFMLSTLSGEAAAAYVHAVISDIEACAEEGYCSARGAGKEDLLERVHALKNAIAPIGSRQLLAACEQLRLDACHGTDRALLERRLQAVARAAVQLIAGFRATSGA
ncbi:hypothetical protein [Xanthomonas sp. CFBP 8445]|uniref:hypothetical protein n=1 Tax=Xanthomonas sp. CFBP 8445 TaxID=2971236 RepID=UPI0021E06A1D|nr:hypothetical protein [Xanthomonas sp. CFBP 8445]UYC11870.1 hypothetical protein NUG21_19320 [Xanthomonas sp. CFBP 8445]